MASKQMKFEPKFSCKVTNQLKATIRKKFHAVKSVFPRTNKNVNASLNFFHKSVLNWVKKFILQLLLPIPSLLGDQGDKIGKIFAQWAIFYLRQILEN
jgi:hypothetical protein